MTENQIKYWAHLENKRHNVVTENETYRANVTDEQERNRHNLASERIDILSLQEQKRHNLAGETENQRHNVESENISLFNAYETKRHNQATEGLEASRIGVERLKLEENRRQFDITSAQNASKLAETERHNRAAEQNSAIANYAKLATSGTVVTKDIAAAIGLSYLGEEWTGHFVDTSGNKAADQHVAGIPVSSEFEKAYEDLKADREAWEERQGKHKTRFSAIYDNEYVWPADRR